MTLAPERTNGHTVQKPGPRFIEVNQGQLVHSLMDFETLATEAITANGYSLQTVLRLPAGAWRQEMQGAHIDTHERLTRLLNEARLAAGRYDGVTPHIEA